MQVDKNQFLSALQVREQYLKEASATTKEISKATVSFQEILDKQRQQELQAGELTFSKHAANRLSDRNIKLTKGQLERLHEGADKAGAKGINESLVLVDDLAFIVNIKNHTVITAIDQNETKENVFTNIDGAVVI